MAPLRPAGGRDRAVGFRLPELRPARSWTACAGRSRARNALPVEAQERVVGRWVVDVPRPGGPELAAATTWFVQPGENRCQPRVALGDIGQKCRLAGRGEDQEDPAAVTRPTQDALYGLVARVAMALAPSRHLAPAGTTTCSSQTCHVPATVPSQAGVSGCTGRSTTAPVGQPTQRRKHLLGLCRAKAEQHQLEAGAQRQVDERSHPTKPPRRR